MSIPPSSPYPQSIQEILDEGRRKDEAARNAPKPHPAQQMLDYHEQVARENNAYDYDPELLAALASQNQQQAKPTDAIKFGHDNGLFDHFPDDMVPSANEPQQPVRVAELYEKFWKENRNPVRSPQDIEIQKQREEAEKCPDVTVQFTFPEEHNAFSSPQKALAAAVPTLRFFHSRLSAEVGVKVGEMPNGSWKLSPVYSSIRAGKICMKKIPAVAGSNETTAEIHSHGSTADKNYNAGQASLSDSNKLKYIFHQSYFVPLNGPARRITSQGEAPAILEMPEHIFHPEFVLPVDNWHDTATASGKAPEGQKQ